MWLLSVLNLFGSISPRYIWPIYVYFISDQNSNKNLTLLPNQSEIVVYRVSGGNNKILHMKIYRVMQSDWKTWHFSRGYNLKTNYLILILKTPACSTVWYKLQAQEKCPFSNCSDLIASHCTVRNIFWDFTRILFISITNLCTQIGGKKS